MCLLFGRFGTQRSQNNGTSKQWTGCRLQHSLYLGPPFPLFCVFFFFFGLSGTFVYLIFFIIIILIWFLRYLFVRLESCGIISNPFHSITCPHRHHFGCEKSIKHSTLYFVIVAGWQHVCECSSEQQQQQHTFEVVPFGSDAVDNRNDRCYYFINDVTHKPHIASFSFGTLSSVVWLAGWLAGWLPGVAVHWHGNAIAKGKVLFVGYKLPINGRSESMCYIDVYKL